MNAVQTLSDDSVTKRYQLPKNIDPRRFPTLPQILTLMMFKDAILSSYRWYDSLHAKSGVEVFADRTFSIACGAGWAAEAIRLLKDLKKEGVITVDLLSKLPAQEPIDPRIVWDECVRNSSRTTNRLHGIRDAGFAHFYDRNEKEKTKRYALAQQAIEALAKGELDAPFVEWTEQNGRKRNSKSCACFAMMAILCNMFGITKGKLTKGVPLARETAASRAREIGDQVLKVGILLENLLAVMLHEADIKCEPYKPSTIGNQ